MKTCTIGSYPKVPSGTGPSIRTAIQRFERGTMKPSELYSTYEAVTRQTLVLSQEARLDAATDGQIRWGDLFDPLCRDVDNLEAGGLLRWFDNNFYYRHPVVTGRLQYQGGALAAWAREAVAFPLPIIVALPGPFTFAALAEDQSYHNSGALLADVVEILALAARSLSSTGIFEVQWDEPGLAALESVETQPNVRSVYGDLINANPELRQSIALYWGSSRPWLDILAHTPAARISIDACADPDALEILQQETFPFEVGLGLLDARDVRLEVPDRVASRLAPVLRRYGEGRVWLHPNSGLEFLPPDCAAQKLNLLRATKAALYGEEVG